MRSLTSVTRDLVQQIDALLADPSLPGGRLWRRSVEVWREVAHGHAAIAAQVLRQRHARVAVLDIDDLGLDAFVVTSNVDGQFQRSGWPDDRVAECHGAIATLQCSRPCGEHLWPADGLEPDIDEALCRWRGPLPTCPRCGAVARPNILMFGDDAWLPGRTAAQERSLDVWLSQVHRPVVVEIGAGTAIPTVRHFGHGLVIHHGAKLLRLNPDDTAVARSAGVGLALGALAGLQALEARWVDGR